MSIKLQLMDKKPDLRIFLDVDDLNNTHVLEDNVKASRNFLLLITEGVMERPFVQLECKTALNQKKNIVLVHDEKSCQFPNPSTVPDDVRPILEPKAIPYYREKAFREVSIQQIIAKFTFK